MKLRAGINAFTLHNCNCINNVKKKDKHAESVGEASLNKLFTNKDIHTFNEVYKDIFRDVQHMYVHGLCSHVVVSIQC